MQKFNGMLSTLNPMRLAQKRQKPQRNLQFSQCFVNIKLAKLFLKSFKKVFIQVLSLLLTKSLTTVKVQTYFATPYMYVK